MTIFRLLVAAAMMASPFTALAQPAKLEKLPPLAVRHLLPIETALEAARAALAQCKSAGFEIAVAILDRDGSLRLLAASPSVVPISIEFAQRKARAAVMFQSKSSAFGERAQASPGFAAAMQAVDPALSGAAGGLPIRSKGEFLGAIGISGAPQGNQDEACAAAGLAAIANAL